MIYYKCYLFFVSIFDVFDSYFLGNFPLVNNSSVFIILLNKFYYIIQKLLKIRQAWFFVHECISAISFTKIKYRLSGLLRFIAFICINEKSSYLSTFSFFTTSRKLAVFPIPGTPDISKIKINSISNYNYLNHLQRQVDEPLLFKPSFKKSEISFFSLSLQGISSGREYSYSISIASSKSVFAALILIF